MQLYAHLAELLPTDHQGGSQLFCSFQLDQVILHQTKEGHVLQGKSQHQMPQLESFRNCNTLKL